jgi:hypothetical protein
VYFSGPHALWRYRLTSGRREVSPLASTPAAFALGSRPVVLTGRSGAWRLRLAEARFTARPAYAEPR